MKKICPNCHNISNGENRILGRGNLLFGGFSLGVGLNEINDDIFGSKALGFAIVIIFVLIGCSAIAGYFIGGKRCPKCKSNDMIPVNDPRAKDIIKQIKHQHPDSICISCYDVGTTQPRNKLNLLASVLLTLAGLLGITLSLVNGHPIYTSIGFFVFFGFGIYGVSTNYFTTMECASCGKVNTVIPLDTPKAQALIKEHNLTIPKEVSQQSTNPKTSQ